MPRYFICIAPFLVVAAVLGLSLAARVLNGPVVALGALAGMCLLIWLPFERQDLPIRMRLDGIYIDAAVKALPAFVPAEQWQARVVAFHIPMAVPAGDYDPGGHLRPQPEPRDIWPMRRWGRW